MGGTPLIDLKPKFSNIQHTPTLCKVVTTNFNPHIRKQLYYKNSTHYTLEPSTLTTFRLGKLGIPRWSKNNLPPILSEQCLRHGCWHLHRPKRWRPKKQFSQQMAVFTDVEQAANHRKNTADVRFEPIQNTFHATAWYPKEPTEYYWIFFSTKWPQKLGFETHCLPPIVHASQGTTRPRRRPKLPQPTRYLKPPHPEVGRNWHQDCGAVVCLSFGFVTKQKCLRRTHAPSDGKSRWSARTDHFLQPIWKEPLLRAEGPAFVLPSFSFSSDSATSRKMKAAPATQILRLPRK